MRPEPECRRADFTEGYKVKLGDGQVWTFPKPVLRLVPVRKEAGGFDLKSAPPFGADYQADLARYIDFDRQDEEKFFESLVLRLSLAVQLLARNYDLTDDEIQELLYLENTPTEDMAEMWSEVDRAVMGYAPKLSAVGSDAS